MDRAPAFSVRSVGRADDLAEPNQSTQRPTAYGQRYISRISNPLSNIFRPGSSPSSSLSVRNAKRRDAFLNRVKRDRDDERFEARGEQLMIMEYLSEEKKWKAAMQRDADKLFQRYNEYGAEEEQEETMPGMSHPNFLFVLPPVSFASHPPVWLTRISAHAGLAQMWISTYWKNISQRIKE